MHNNGCFFFLKLCKAENFAVFWVGLCALGRLADNFAFRVLAKLLYALKFFHARGGAGFFAADFAAFTGRRLFFCCLFWGAVCRAYNLFSVRLFVAVFCCASAAKSKESFLPLLKTFLNRIKFFLKDLQKY